LPQILEGDHHEVSSSDINRVEFLGTISMISDFDFQLEQEASMNEGVDQCYM
jgi:hypothetical protein